MFVKPVGFEVEEPLKPAAEPAVTTIACGVEVIPA